MQKSEIKNRIEILRKELDFHRIQYHVNDSPKISDEVYDSLMRGLVKLEGENPEFDDELSPTKRIGGEALENFQKIKHEIKQWSYDNVFDFEELTAWEKRNFNYLKKETEFFENKKIDKNNTKASDVFSYFCELKIDGLKIILTYRDGRLVSGVTRGDGEVGEDVTENIKTIKSIPLILKDKVSCVVIGECYIKKSDFEKINKQRKLNAEEEYKNPRNLAAGTLRQLDTRLVAERKLQFFAYDTENFSLENIEDKKTKEYYLESLENQNTELKLLKELGFYVNSDSLLCRNLDEVQKYYEEWNSQKRLSQEFGIDGVVIKMDNKEIENFLGFTAKSPRSGIAYKLKAEEAVSRLLSVTYQVGRTGAVTPVAELYPVELAGTTVKRATLHNFDEIERLGIRIGDSVMMRKAGDIIPQVFDVLVNLRSGKEQKISEISECPECNSKLVKDIESGAVKIICKNEKCPAKMINKVIYFASRKCMNIDGLGESTVEALFQAHLIKNSADIYKLKKEDILKLEGFKDKSADNLISAIEKSKDVNLDVFITSLGIPGVGAETAYDLAGVFKSWNSFYRKENAVIEDFSRIYGIGEKIAAEIVSWQKSESEQKVVEALLKYVKVVDFTESSAGKKLENLSFVITGTFEEISRSEIEKLIKENGGKVGSDISKSTSYLIKGEGGGSKSDKAAKNNIKIISLGEFNKML